MYYERATRLQLRTKGLILFGVLRCGEIKLIAENREYTAESLFDFANPNKIESLAIKSRIFSCIWVMHARMTSRIRAKISLNKARFFTL